MRLSQIACALAFCAFANQVSRANGIEFPNPISLLPTNQRQDERPTERGFKVEAVDYKSNRKERKCRKPVTRYDKILVENGVCLQ